MRVNVEDSLFGDYRFKALIRILGDEDRALGMCVRFWRSATKHWGDGELIPGGQFEIEGFQPLLNVGLAVVEDGGIRAKGLLTHIDWVRQKRESASAAGRASAAARKLKYGSAQPKIRDQHNDLEQPFDNSRTAVERTFGPFVERSNAHAHALALALAHADETTNQPKINPSSSLNQRAHAYDQQNYPQHQSAGHDDDGFQFSDLEWEQVDQSPLTSVGAKPIERAGLIKLGKVGFTPTDVADAIAQFVADAPFKYRGKRIENPTGLLMSQMLSMRLGK
jgi:hypothetical protein